MTEMPGIGATARDFELPSTQGQVRLSDLTTNGKVVLAFYEEDNTPLCFNQVTVLKEDYELMRQLRTEVVAVSADAMDSHLEFEESLGGLPFPLVSDENLEAAKAYGVLGEDGKRSRRAVFVIDKGAEILHIVPKFEPDNASQYEEIFAALGFDV